MKLLASLSLLLLVGCKCGHTTTMKERAQSKPTDAQTPASSSTFNKDRLLGIWTDGSTENATFNIQRDSIFYVDQLIAYKYNVKEDTITINYADWAFKGKASFIKDTLVIASEDGQTKYWKFKQ